MADAFPDRPRHFAAGRTVLRREVLHGLPWMEQPVTVVDDADDCLAVLLEPGSPFTFIDHPFGPHPWAGRAAWTGSTVLQLQRPGDAHAARRFSDARGAFTGWYVNFQAPLVRHTTTGGGGAFETADHGIDLVLPAGTGRWEWKDVDDPDAMVASGRITPAERDGIRAEADGVAAVLAAGPPWWTPWHGWRPGDAPPAS